MLQSLKNLLKVILPISVKKKLKILQAYFGAIAVELKIRTVQYRYQKVLAKIKSKERIKVTFFLIHHADWKYEGVYQLMKADKRFDPIVIVCPYISYGEEFMFKVMNEAYETFINGGYKVIKSYNDNTGKWLNVKKEIKPDIVCFTSPWNLTKQEYLIENFLNTLTCYVPYGYKISHLYQAHFNQPMQNLVWKFFVETEIHKKLSLKYSQNKAVNTIVTGYPGMDKFLKKDQEPLDVWKIKDRKVKRIIWAPHHSIPGKGGNLNYSTFLKFSDIIFDFAKRYKNDIQIAFKPHPILRVNLSKDDIWGKFKTDNYFMQWNDLPNGQLIEGDYVDLFFTSDAMIHDSGSFLIEYLYTKKPVMFLWNDDAIPDRFNEVGKMALTKLYRGDSKNDIEKFINDIISENDFLKEERIQFFEDVITPPNQVSASENIFNFLQSAIFN